MSAEGYSRGPGSGGPRRRDDRGRRDDRPRGRRRPMRRRKVCPYCADKSLVMTYKDGRQMARFITDRGKIVPRRTTGVCAKHQRKLTTHLKRAREMALIHYSR